MLVPRPLLLKSFCGYELKFGSIGVLCFMLVYQIIRLVIVSQRKDQSSVHIFENIWIAIEMAFIVLAFHGVKKGSQYHLIPYMVVQTLDLISVYGYYGYLVIINTHLSEWSSINLVLFYIASWEVALFCLATIYSHYVELSDDELVAYHFSREPVEA
ncbi:uncharacterized protein LOC135834700 isoform X3 [Planococcus citri]|uniref:uncharacterized protein LOC135834700 isoform X3 n=1 Tax=Planococcus citri TaxID=170843 RepID=UPI0031F9268A